MGIHRLFASLKPVLAFLFIIYADTSFANRAATHTFSPKPIVAPRTDNIDCQDALVKRPKFNEFTAEQAVVLDTNILVNDPNSFHNFGKARVIIPMTVLNELNKFKSEDQGSARGRGAREFHRAIYALIEKYPNRQEYPTRDGGTVEIAVGGKISEEVKEALQEESNDAKIIEAAFKLHKEKKDVLFVTQDVNALVKAKVLQIKTSKYINPFMNQDDSAFTGVSTLEFEDSAIENFIEKGEIELPIELAEHLKENQFIVMRQKGAPDLTDLEDVDSEDVGRITIHRDENKKAIRITMTKLIDLDEVNFPIRPRNLEQYLFIDLLCADHIPLKTAIGQAGSGKTLLAVSWAVWKVLTQGANEIPLRIFITRPTVEAGQRLGFLPGDMKGKVGPYVEPFMDALTTLAQIANDRNWMPIAKTSSIVAQAGSPQLPKHIPSDGYATAKDLIKIFPKGFFEERTEKQQKQWLNQQRSQGKDYYADYNRVLKDIRKNKRRPNREERRKMKMQGKNENEEVANTDVRPGSKNYWSVEKFIKDARIEMAALQFIRGRSFSNAIILADEMQNDLPHIAKTLGTRAANDTWEVMLGDPNQIDSMFLDRFNNGLSVMIDRMEPSPASGHITLKKNERSFLSKEVTEAFGDHEKQD